MSDFTNKNIMSNGSIEQISDEQLKQFKSDADIWNAGEKDRLLDDLRVIRNKLLAECDLTQMADISDSRMDNLTKGKWQVYREELRDITNGLDTVDNINNVPLPTNIGMLTGPLIPFDIQSDFTNRQTFV